ncbi:MAG TPA: 4Fe-4S dicluster domain-containing protein [Longimicrobiales bacterium]|nr:4Fe-4S dicluster domain-containing protein [Longimicrobiales bacterium]
MASKGNGIERRDFLKVLGAAGATATLAGCANEPDRLIPYLVQPEEIVPGTSTWYRTTCRECPAGCGMTVRTREGRALKAEGNPESPISHGKLCARGQASLHGLYDPDRIPQALVREGESWGRVSWDRAEQTLADALRNAGGRAVFLGRPEPGSMDALLDEWTAALGVRRVRFEAYGHEPLRAAHRRLFGVDALPIHEFENARTVVSFGGDFLETFLSPVDYAHGFAEGHAYGNGRRGTLIWVAPHQSLTGLNADEWLAARPGTEHLVALAMARLVADETGRAARGGMLDGVDARSFAEAAGVSFDQVRLAAVRFTADGPSLAVGPGIATTSAAATTLAAAVVVLNEVAGNYGRTVWVGPPVQDRATHARMAGVLREMEAGDVSALLVHGPNPLYELADRDAVERALAAVPFIASFSPWLDETSARAHLLVPDHHFLETWGDYEPRPGVRSLVQPVMTPVFDTKQTGDVLLSVARRAGAAVGAGATTFYDYLRERWAGSAGGAGDEGWTAALRRGVVVADQATQGAPAAGTAVGGAAGAAVGGTGGAAGGLSLEPPPLAGDGDLHLVVYPSYRFYDGRLANRPWLQELPDPVTKHTWGSVVEIHPATADDLGLDNGHIVEVRTAQGAVELPVYRHPGVRRDTVAIQLGQGHEALGRYAKDRGVNAIRLLAPQHDAESGALVWIQAMATVTPTGAWERQPFSSTQEDLSGRHLFETMPLSDALDADRAATVTAVAGAGRAAADHGEEGGGGLTGEGAEQEVPAPGGHGAAVDPMRAQVRTLQESGGFAPATVEASPQGYPPPGTHYGEYAETQPRWGMTVDMDRCIGCSACQVACQAENNIGMVGPELVAQGRLIQWIRIERYFEEEHGEAAYADEGGAAHRPVTFLPMLCQHCSNAPCEPVCPVYAAYHTPDGLNAQIYNRCVGTRYCANNCPYKVRYFNYFSYEWPEPLNWQLNPDVTVREKGIMEKCTFCVQRIRDTQHRARLGGRYVRDGEIVPACAQTCPTNVIAFGDIADPGSRVAQIAASGRSFRVFEELNTQPGIVYLKKVAEHGTEGAAH